jgi:hypothetical protein
MNDDFSHRKEPPAVSIDDLSPQEQHTIVTPPEDEEDSRNNNN